ncbi:hypothetical protein N2152v2_001500 [Parachlorella kessleri]
MPLLALPGPQYWHDFENGGFVGRGTGWSVWDGAVAAAKHLEQLALERRLPAFEPPIALELGSGTGLAGLAAAVATGLATTLTDLAEVLPALRRNVEANREVAADVTVAPCDWMAPDLSVLTGPYGLVVAADCVWLGHFVEPFVGTLKAVTGPTTQVLLSYQSRSSRVDHLLFSLLEQTFVICPAERLPGEPDRGKIDVYWLRRKEHTASTAAGVG